VLAQDLPPPSPWGKSRAKAQLIASLADATSPIHGMTPTEIHLSDPLYQRYKLANFKSSLKRLVDNPGGSRGPNWGKSEAKGVLRAMLVNPKSKCHSLTVEELYKSVECFQKFPLKNFIKNFNNLKERLEFEKEIVLFDDAAVAREQKRFPRKAITNKGCPFWDTHSSKKLLEADVRKEGDKKIKPSEHRNTKDEYKLFSPKIFRGHVNQERRKQKEAAGWVDKRNKFTRRKFDEMCKEVAKAYEEEDSDDNGNEEEEINDKGKDDESNE
jgi:hypothetical protein